MRQPPLSGDRVRGPMGSLGISSRQFSPSPSLSLVYDSARRDVPHLFWLASVFVKLPPFISLSLFPPIDRFHSSKTQTFPTRATTPVIPDDSFKSGHTVCERRSLCLGIVRIASSSVTSHILPPLLRVQVLDCAHRLRLKTL